MQIEGGVAQEFPNMSLYENLSNVAVKSLPSLERNKTIRALERNKKPTPSTSVMIGVTRGHCNVNNPLTEKSIAKENDHT